MTAEPDPCLQPGHARSEAEERAPLPPTLATTGHPPLVPPVLQVGLIGHRNLPATVMDTLQTAAVKVLDDIRAHAVAVAGRNGDLRLRAVCALAEGADVLLAEAALQHGYRLVAPLPFHRDLYREDFETPPTRDAFDRLLRQAEAVYELDGSRASPVAYQAVGRLLLEQSDLVVAIWDGNPELGPGGTGQILREAWLAEIPTVIIAAQAPHEVRIFDPLASGAVSDLGSIVGRMLAFAPPAGSVDDLAIFLAEGVARSTAPPADPHAAAPHASAAQDGDAAVAAVLARVAAILGPHFEAVDQLAVRYGKLYRASGTLRYLIALPSTVGAFLAFYTSPELSRLGFLIQLVTLGGALAIYAIDRRAQWHRRFLDYRFLAEHLRASRIMALLGSTVALPRLRSGRTGTGDDWVAFRLRGTVRSLGLVSARVDAPYLAAVRTAVSAEITSQVAFYDARAARYRSSGTWLQRAGLSLYGLGLVFTIVRGGMGVAAYSGAAYDLMAELALVLPSLAPIFLGLRSQSEFNRLSQRYASMAKELRRIDEALASNDIRRNGVERMAREMVHVLLAEVMDWRVLIKARDLSPF